MELEVRHEKGLCDPTGGVAKKKYWHGSQTPKTVIQDIKDFYVWTKNAYSATVFSPQMFTREARIF